jgi:hypothetical protein
MSLILKSFQWTLSVACQDLGAGFALGSERVLWGEACLAEGFLGDGMVIKIESW